jgi:hypothetical protein
MKKVLLLSFVIFGLSGCYSPIKYEYEVRVDGRWWKHGVLITDMYRATNECSVGLSSAPDIWDPKYKDFRMKYDVCMLQKGFSYMACERQYGKIMPIDLCENKLSSEYDYPGCQSYREKELRKDSIKFFPIWLFKILFLSYSLDEESSDIAMCDGEGLSPPQTIEWYHRDPVF